MAGPATLGRLGGAGVLVVHAALASAACGGGDAAENPWTMRVDTLDGVVHVQHSGRAPVMGVAPVVAVGEVGGLEEPSPAEFGRVRSVVADADGRFYVADDMALEIRVFDREGRYVRALGRRGSGPGEMEGIHGAAWLTPDTMLVVDYGNARLLLMDRDGRHLGQWPWMRATGSIRFFYRVRDGEIYTHGLRSAGVGEVQRQQVERVWVRYGPEGARDTVAIPQRDGPVPGTSAICRGDGIGIFNNPHGDRLLTTPAPHGERIVAMASDYRLAFLDPAGDTVRILSRDADPVPLTEEDWRETAEGYAEFRERWRGAACEGEIRRPRHHPTLRDIGFDHDGRLMVELNTPDGPSLDIYDIDGRWLATLALPERDPRVPLFLRDDLLYLVARDTLGVQRVEGYELRDPDRDGIATISVHGEAVNSLTRRARRSKKDTESRATRFPAALSLRPPSQPAARSVFRRS